MADVSWAVDDLRRIRTRLATGSNTQGSVPSSLWRNKVAPGVYEMALELDDVALMLPQVVASGHLSNQAAQSVEAAADRLKRMSGQNHVDLWTPDALRPSDDWSSVRRLAAQALQHLGGRGGLSLKSHAHQS